MTVLNELKTHYNKFRDEASVLANLMAAEFNRKKAAKQMSKASMSRSGSIDKSRLSRYQVSDDIFKRNVVLPQGDSYSLHILVDWSASMGHIILNVVEQAIIQALFCKKVGIRFEVVSFNSMSSTDPRINEAQSNEFTSEYSELSKNLPSYHIDRSGALQTFHVTSDLNHQDFEKALKYFWLIGAFCSNVSVSLANGKRLFPADIRSAVYSSCVNDNDNDDKAREFTKIISKYKTGGTALNAALIKMNNHMRVYKKKFSIDKQKLIVLSDGHTSMLPRPVYAPEKGAPFIYTPRGFFDMTSGNTVNYDPVRHSTNVRIIETNMILDLFEKSVDKLCFFMIPDVKKNRNSKHYAINKIGEVSLKPTYTIDLPLVRKILVKEGFIKIKESYGFDKFFIANMVTCSEDSQTEVKRNQKSVANALIKGDESTKMLRNIVTQFVKYLLEEDFSL